MASAVVHISKACILLKRSCHRQQKLCSHVTHTMYNKNTSKVSKNTHQRFGISLINIAANTYFLAYEMASLLSLINALWRNVN